MISDSIVEEVRSRADLVEIVAEHTRLKRSGKTFRGPCPLHHGEGPNFSVDPVRNIYKCFVCGESGDLFSFPMKQFGMSFNEAVRWVGERVGIVIPEERKEVREADPHAHLYEANAFAAEWFRGQLLDPEEGLAARDYLEGRGISPEMCERFSIGWAPESWDGLANAARVHGIEPVVLLQLGLLKESTRNAREPYDAFRGRIIFPIESLSGRVVAFGGRVTASVEDHVPKYLNSPDSPIYHKGDVLYGLRSSRGAIRKEEVALVVEGYMDYVSLVAHGVENVVAPLGTAMTQQQAELISRYAGRVILLYDSDKAGLKATFRSGDELLRAGAEVLVATLPAGEDPDSLVRAGGAARLRPYLNDAVDVLERKIQILERKDYFSSIAGKRRAVDALLPTVRAASDDVLRSLYVSRIAERTGIPVATLEAEVGKPAREPGTHGRAREQLAQPETRPERTVAVQAELPLKGPALGPERNLILLLLRDEQWVEKVAPRLGPQDFQDPIYREIFVELLQLYAEGGRGEGLDWLGSLSDPATAKAQELFGDPEGWNISNPGLFFEQTVREMEDRPDVARLIEFNREMDQVSDTRQLELLGNKRALRQTMEQTGRVLRTNPSKRMESRPERK
jgi:DNA primase